MVDYETEENCYCKECREEDSEECLCYQCVWGYCFNCSKAIALERGKKKNVSH